VYPVWLGVCAVGWKGWERWKCQFEGGDLEGEGEWKGRGRGRQTLGLG